MKSHRLPDSKVSGANKGPTWVLSAPGGSHVGPINLVISELAAVSHGMLPCAAIKADLIDETIVVIQMPIISFSNCTPELLEFKPFCL